MSAPTNASSRKRPRHFQQGPDEAEEQQREATIAAAQPPSARLYKHALESIFGFLDLKNLNSVLQVSRLWSSAVDSMKSIEHAMVKLPDGHPLFELCASRLARHISELDSQDEFTELNQEQLYLLRLRLTGLHALRYRLPPPLVGPLLFPASLTRLITCPSSTVEANSILEAAGSLPTLQFLGMLLDGPAPPPEINFAPLRRSATLDFLCLHLRTLNLKVHNLTHQQADDLRAVPSLTQLKLPLDGADLSLLLRAPQEVKLKGIEIKGNLDVESTALVALLPSLQRLILVYATRVPFLDLLPNLNALHLRCFQKLWEVVQPQQMIEGLGPHSRISTLVISDSLLTCAHMSAILSRLPAVSELRLEKMPELESLSFLSSSGPLASLTTLSLRGCRHPSLLAVELEHVYFLQQLTSLEVQDCFSERLDSLTLDEFTAPSVRLPKLVKSVIQCAPPAAATP